MAQMDFADKHNGVMGVMMYFFVEIKGWVYKELVHIFMIHTLNLKNWLSFFYFVPVHCFEKRHFTITNTGKRLEDWWKIRILGKKSENSCHPFQKCHFCNFRTKPSNSAEHILKLKNLKSAKKSEKSHACKQDSCVYPNKQIITSSSLALHWLQGIVFWCAGLKLSCRAERFNNFTQFSWRFIMKSFLWSFSPSADARRAFVSYWQKYVHKYWLTL